MNNPNENPDIGQRTSLQGKVENPYVGPRTFQQSEGDKFFGRDQEARDLLNLIISDRMVLFYAQSGAGKSSLINTRVIPGLLEKGFEVLPVGRVGGDLPSGCPADNVFVFNLMRSLHEHEGGQDSFAGLDLATFLACLNQDERGYFYDPRPVEGDAAGPEAGAPASGGGELWPRALIIDQFEELLSTHPEAWEQRDGFFTQLANAAAADPYLWVVLVMREDYAASLAPYTYLLPGSLRARYYMQQMGRAAALDAVKGPVKDCWRFDEGVAEQLVDDLSKIKVQKPDGSGVESLPGPYVEPVQLQVVCYRLWESLGAGHSLVTTRDLQGIGDVDQSLAKYYSDCVAEVAAATAVAERKIRDWFGRQLITGLGVRGQVLKGDTASGEMENEVVYKLQDAHLVRFENRGGATWIELTHDRLVEPIRADNEQWTQRNLSMLQRAAELWEQQDKPAGLLLGDQSLVDAQRWADKHLDELTVLDKDFLAASWDVLRREKLEREHAEREQALKLEAAQKVADEKARAAKKLRQRAVVLVVLLLLAVALTIFSAYSTLQANILKSTAVAQEKIANQYAAVIAGKSTQEAFGWETSVAEKATSAEQEIKNTMQFANAANKETLIAQLVSTNAQMVTRHTQLVETQTLQAQTYQVEIGRLLKTINVTPTMTATPTPSPTETPTPAGVVIEPVYPVTISNVKVNGTPAPIDWDKDLPRKIRLAQWDAAPGDVITVQMDYKHEPDTVCPGCIDEILVGFSDAKPLGCIYIGMPGIYGAFGNAEISVTVPNDPGPHYLGFDRPQDYSCPEKWWTNPAENNRYFLKINVVRVIPRRVTTEIPIAPLAP